MTCSFFFLYSDNFYVLLLGKMEIKNFCKKESGYVKVFKTKCIKIIKYLWCTYVIAIASKTKVCLKMHFLFNEAPSIDLFRITTGKFTPSWLLSKAKIKSDLFEKKKNLISGTFVRKDQFKVIKKSLNKIHVITFVWAIKKNSKLFQK